MTPPAVEQSTRSNQRVDGSKFEQVEGMSDPVLVEEVLTDKPKD